MMEVAGLTPHFIMSLDVRDSVGNQPRRRTILQQLLTPGIGVKRWFILLLIGAALIGLGFAALLVEIYRYRPDPLWSTILWLARFPLWAWALILGLTGGGLALYAAVTINRNLLAPLDMGSRDLLDAIIDRRQLQRGPSVVAIGGGTGLPTLLRGIKEYTSNITAIVTVADDGGSSGRLRRELGILPPGDFRNNIAALSRDESLMTQLFQYRFGGEEGLGGHSFGNLFITAMSAITGSFEQALSESSRVLAIRGQVIPSTLDEVALTAEIIEAESGILRRVEGESAIPEAAGRIRRVALEPDDVRAYPGAVRAILSADLIVIGPGSLYTSVLPNLLVPGISDAIKASRAPTVYICNVATQDGETDHFTVHDHVEAIRQHVGDDRFSLDYVVANNLFLPLPPGSRTIYVKPGENNENASKNRNDGPDFVLIEAALVDRQRPWRHDSSLLAEQVLGLLQRPVRQPSSL